MKSRGTQNTPPKKRDKVFDKIDIKDRKEKFLNLENKAKKVSWVDPIILIYQRSVGYWVP